MFCVEDLLAFLDELEKDEDLKKAFLEVKGFADVCRLAKSYGYYFTVDELEEYYMQQVAGGSLVHEEIKTGTINQNVNGNGNFMMNYGDATVTDGYVDMTEQAKVDPMAVLGMVLGKR